MNVLSQIFSFVKLFTTKARILNQNGVVTLFTNESICAIIDLPVAKDVPRQGYDLRAWLPTDGTQSE